MPLIQARRALLKRPAIISGGTNNLALDHSNQITGTNTSTVSTTLNVTAGDLIYVLAMDFIGTPVVTDGTNTYSARSGSPFSGGGHGISVATAVAAGTGSITVSATNGGAYSALFVLAVKGVNASPFDGSVQTASPDPVSITTSHAFTMIIGAAVMGSTGTTAGSGFTLINGADFFAVEYKIVSTTQSGLSVGWTTNSGASHVIIADALVSS